MWKYICAHLVYFFLSYFNKKRKKKNPIPFVHTPVNCFKYLSLFLVGGEGRGEKWWRKALHFSFFIGWIGCLQGFSCNIYKCCLHHSTTTKHGNGVAVALLRLCVQYVWNKKGKLFSQAVLCFIIGSVRSYPYCTELASGDCQECPRIHFGGCCCRRLSCFGIFNDYTTVECFPMWLSSFYGLAVYFSLFLTVNFRLWLTVWHLIY